MTSDAAPPTLLVTTPYFPPEGGGLEVYALNVNRELAAAHGWRVVIVTSGAHGTRPSHTHRDGLTVYRLPAQVRLSNTRFSAAWRRQLAHIVRRERPVLINAHAPVPGLADLVAALSAVPLVVTWHAGSMRKGRPLPDAMIRTYERTLCRRLLARAAWVIASSDTVRDTFLGPVRAKCSIVGPGIDTHRFSPADRRHPHRVVFVGGLNRRDTHNGLAELLDAINELAPGRPQLELDVVGGGSARGHFEQMTRNLGIADRVRFRGRLGGDDLVAAMQAGGLLALPTRNDSFPLVILEAMACGLPVISSAVGDIPKMVDEGVTGHLVPPDQPAMFSQRIAELIDDPDRADRMGRAARDKALGAATWQAQAARTDEIFRAVLAGRSPARRRNLAVVAPFFPPKIGGLERYAEAIARGLVARGDWDVTVFAANHRAGRTVVEVAGGLTIHRMRAWFTLSSTPVNPLWLWYLRRAFAANRIDAVHVHTPVPFLADVAGRASGSLPLIVTYHAGSMLKNRQPADLAVGFYERHLLPLLLQRADALVGVSPSVVEWLPDRHASKASVISPGVDSDRFLPGRAAHAPDGQPVILYVGKISTATAWKGVATLLDAFGIIHHQNPTARLRLVGDGDAIDEHAATVERMGLTDRVEFSGPLLDHALIGAYQGASVVVLPSLTEAESFGMSLIEAMACATPVVASRVGGIPFVVDDGRDGLLVPPGDAHSLAAACLRVLGDARLAAALGSAGRAKVLEHYRWPAQVEKYEALLQNCTAGAAPTASAPLSRRRPPGAGRSKPA